MAKQFRIKNPRYRWQELGLLIIPFLILLVALTQLLLANVDQNSPLSTKNLPTIQGLIPVFGLIGALLTANVIMSIFFRKADQVLLPLVGLLSGIGVLMSTRLGADLCSRLKNGQVVCNTTLGSRQLLWVLVGITICIATLFVLRNMNFLARYKYTWAALSVLLLIPSIIIGIRTFKSAAPTHDNLTLAGLNLQPSELLKISIVIFFAGYLSENREMISQGYLRLGFLRLPPMRQLGPLIMMLGVALIIFLVVRELGLALLIYGLFLCMTYLGSGKIGYVIGSLAIFAFLAFIGYSLLSYIRLRFTTVGFNVLDWQHWTAADNDYATGSGLQILQGLIATSSGGILGAGLGLGHPTFVPVIESDMVLTALAEELGLAGIFAIIGLYLLIVYRGFRIAIEATEPFNQLLAAGLTSVFAIQTLIIAAGNLKFIPLTGIPLPFLSHGGSSLFANFIIIGILLRISHNTALEREGLA